MWKYRKDDALSVEIIYFNTRLRLAIFWTRIEMYMLWTLVDEVLVLITHKQSLLSNIKLLVYTRGSFILSHVR